MLDDPNEEPVDAAIFREGLSCLGKTFNNARHAYLKLSISERGLTTIKVSQKSKVFFLPNSFSSHCDQGIGRYKYLQYIDVSGNSLTTLQQLTDVKHLIKLNASNNRIKKMLDFAPPANLEVIDYSHNEIEQIENVMFNPYVKHLCLDDNRISKIEGITGNKSLRSLSLRQNNITKIENLDNLNLEELYLSHN